MKGSMFMVAAAAVTLLVAGSGVAGPMRVKTYGAKSQTVVMCPDCKEKIACAKAGDYTIGFDADLDSPKTGAARLAVHVKDAAGKPVNNAKVAVRLSMPKHEHDARTVTLKSAGHGRYHANTQLVMPGGWNAEVQVTPASGDTIKQGFSFAR